MNLSFTELLLLYNIDQEFLLPVNKLINKQELIEILENFKFNGEIYSLPFLFFIDDHPTEPEIKFYFNNKLVAIVEVESSYTIDFPYVCEQIFKTQDVAHPGVAALLQNKNRVCVSGNIKYFDVSVIKNKIPYTDPVTNGYVFQSRNPPHRAHEYIVNKYAPDVVYTTPYNTTNTNDYPFDVKIKTYEKMKEIYGIKIFVSTLPRVFAGPREALQNAILFKNIGIENFIFGRGKNCIGNYYSDMESYDLCKKYETELNIHILYQDTIVVNGVEPKGSIIKHKYINNGEQPPEELMSKYISEILLNG